MTKVGKKTKTFITVLALTCMFCMQCYPVLSKSLAKNNSELFHGKIEINKGGEIPEGIYTGETEVVEKGTKLKMTVSSVLSSGLSESGDEFFAEVTTDLEAKDGVTIPAGTIAHGRVSTLSQSKRLGRDGYIQIDFDYLITPDGREIPIEASMTTKRNAATSVGKVILEDTGYVLGGGLLGSLIALRWLGIGTAVSTHGATVVGGAGLGAVAGATAAFTRKGSEALLAPGDEMKVKIKGDIKLPVLSENAFKEKEKHMDGLTVRITEYSLDKDPFGELNTITIGIDVDNRTKQTFSSFDMALVSDYKTTYYPSPFGNTGLWFKKIEPNSKTQGKLSFSVDNPKRKHWLVFFDTSSRKPLAKISVDNAERTLKKIKKRK